MLKPIQIDQNNSYRYYSTEQFEQLNTIQYLKEIGFTLKKIKRHLDHRDIDGFLALLEKQKTLTENKIKELERVNRKFQNRIEDIRTAREIKNLGVATIKEMKERRIVRLMEKITTEPEMEVSLRQLENMANMNASIFIGGVGHTIGMDHVIKSKFDEYNSIFILIEEEDIQNSLVTTFREGKYACINYRGDHHNSSPYYKILLDFIKENELHITGDSIERTIIDHYISKDKEDYLTEIQIPVKC